MGVGGKTIRGLFVDTAVDTLAFAHLLALPSTPKSRTRAASGAAAALWLSVQSKRAQVAALRALHARASDELRARQAAEAELRGKWAQITDHMADYQRQAALLCYLSRDGAALAADLAAQAAEARGILSGGLAPRARSAAAAARARVGGAQREADAARRLPAAALAAGPGGGATALARVAAAAAQLSRAGADGLEAAAAATAGGVGDTADGSSGGDGDGAAVADPGIVAALGAARALDELAPIKCPSGLIASVVGELGAMDEGEWEDGVWPVAERSDRWHHGIEPYKPPPIKPNKI